MMFVTAPLPVPVADIPKAEHSHAGTIGTDGGFCGFLNPNSPSAPSLLRSQSTADAYLKNLNINPFLISSQSVYPSTTYPLVHPTFIGQTMQTTEQPFPSWEAPISISQDSLDCLQSILRGTPCISPESVASTAGSSAQMSSAHSNSSQLNDEDYRDDFAKLPSSSPHMTPTALEPMLLPGQSMTKQAIIAPGPDVPYGEDRVVFVETLLWSCLLKMQELWPDKVDLELGRPANEDSIRTLFHEGVVRALSGTGSALDPLVEKLKSQTTIGPPEMPSPEKIPLPLFFVEMVRRMRTSVFLLLTAMRWIVDLHEYGIVQGMRDTMQCGFCKSHAAGCTHFLINMANKGMQDSAYRFDTLQEIDPTVRRYARTPWKKAPAPVGAHPNMKRANSHPNNPNKKSGPNLGGADMEKYQPLLERHPLAPLADPKKTLLGALVLASKFHRDNTAWDKVWGNVVGLPAYEVGKAESAVGMGLGWELNRHWVGSAYDSTPTQERPSLVSRTVDTVGVDALWPRTRINSRELRDREPGSTHTTYAEPIFAHVKADADKYGVKALLKESIPGPVDRNALLSKTITLEISTAGNRNATPASAWYEALGKGMLMCPVVPDSVPPVRKTSTLKKAATAPANSLQFEVDNWTPTPSAATQKRKAQYDDEVATSYFNVPQPKRRQTTTVAHRIDAEQLYQAADALAVARANTSRALPTGSQNIITANGSQNHFDQQPFAPNLSGLGYDSTASSDAETTPDLQTDMSDTDVSSHDESSRKGSVGPSDSDTEPLDEGMTKPSSAIGTFAPWNVENREIASSLSMR